MSVMRPRSERRRRAVAIAVIPLVALSLAACNTITGKTESTVPPIPSLTSAAPTPPPPPPTTGPPPLPTPSDTPPPATQPQVPTTVAVTTTTEPIALQELVLTGDGLGSA